MKKTIEIQTACKLIGGTSQLHIEAGTNGPKGGDSGHGSRTVVRIADAGGTDWKVTVVGDQSDEDGVFDSPSAVEITLGGDSELSTLIRALEFALAALKGTAEGAETRLRDTLL
jgi:hypothetical protein